MDNEKKKKKFRRLARAIVLLVVVLLAGAFGSLGYFHYAPSRMTCLSCHEIRPSYDTWTTSSHREIPCRKCHGGALSSGFHGLRENAKRVVRHFTKNSHDNIRLGEEQVVDMTVKCRACHQSEYASWLAGGHSATYPAIFLNKKHNKAEQLNPDCLRCHGMFFESTIEHVAAPLTTEGPWHLLKSELATRPTIPCLACHQMHTSGTVAMQPDYAEPGTIASKRALRSIKTDFYDRREKVHFAAADLPQPRIHLNGNRIEISPDLRQRVCAQCHAPESSLDAGTSDDRTPRGVHAGLSCLACHESHSNDARASCAHCHPSLSNCGLDVEKMDTTYLSPGSKHNIHFVGCSDCHPQGAPEKSKR